MTTVTLGYECDGGQQPTANFVAAVAAVQLDEGELALLGMTVQTDTTAEVPNTNTVSRTVVLFIQNNSPFDPNVPGSDPETTKSAVRGIWTNKLALRIPARVTALEPVLT